MLKIISGTSLFCLDYNLFLTGRTGRIRIWVTGGGLFMPMTVREAVRLLLDAGFVEVNGGKGSHRKFEKAGCRPVIITSHSKEISRVVERTVRKAVEQ